MRISSATGGYEVRFICIQEALEQLPENSFAFTDVNVDGALLAGWDSEKPKMVFAAGESTKSVANLERGLNWLADVGANRRSTVVAIGGGVIGDLAGFIAATYMRGIGCIQVPTSLLAQVDSAIGGKVGVDLHQGKNLAGAIRAPLRVDVDVNALGTLSGEHFVNGCAEVWKYGWIASPSLLSRLEAEPLRKDSADLQQVIEQCIAIKAAIVEEDEFEESELRSQLNFGHTIGHAIEAAMSYTGILHGEAIAIGMVLEARLGEILGITEMGTANRVRKGLERQGLPTMLPRGLDSEQLIEFMRRDKKVTGNKLAFSMINAAGACKLVQNVDEGVVRQTLTPE